MLSNINFCYLLISPFKTWSCKGLIYFSKYFLCSFCINSHWLLIYKWPNWLQVLNKQYTNLGNSTTKGLIASTQHIVPICKISKAFLILLDWYQICIDELDVEVKFGIHKTCQSYPTSYSMWQVQHISFHLFHFQKV